jgi:high-affinity iron transporter
MRTWKNITLGAAFLLVVGVILWQAFAVSGNPNPLSAKAGSPAGILDIGVLVFREGLECILVLAAITAGMSRSERGHGASIGTGVGIGFIATLISWFVAITVVDDLSKQISALQLQAATGLLAILVLLVVMNWFFHKLYWTGWISLHNKRKNKLLYQSSLPKGSGAHSRVFWGMAFLGFTSFYREGVEVVLFLQGYRLRLGQHVVFEGVSIGLLLTAAVGALTFVAHRKLPYKRMLIVTGVMLGAVLLVMVGEQVQEMQIAGWMSTTQLPSLARFLPGWTGLWFSTFPNVEGLLAQCFAAVLVLGSYVLAAKPKSNAKRTAAKHRELASQL